LVVEESSSHDSVAASAHRAALIYSCVIGVKAL